MHLLCWTDWNVCTDGPCPVREEKIIEGVNYVEEARRDLQANVNYKYALRNLILKIGG